MFAKLESILLICFSILIFGDCKSQSDHDQLEAISRIRGGNPAPLGAFPYQVSLRHLNNSHYCGGALISDRWVLSAASCVYNKLPNQLIIVVGAESVWDGTIYVCENITRHELFDPKTLANDIAVLKTSREVLNTTLVAPTFYDRFMMSCNDLFATTITTTGWGDTQAGSAIYLQYLNVTAISVFECKVILSTYEPADEILVSTSTLQQTCVYGIYSSGASVCSVDNGAPLFIAQSGTVTGVLSYATCTEKIPAVYTGVGYYQDWIRTQTNVPGASS